MSSDDIAAVIEKIPELGIFGVGIHDPGIHDSASRGRRLILDQESLIKSAETCGRICQWIKENAKQSKRIESKSSYVLKHIAERDIGYITNGQFICAAVHCGFKFKVIGNGPNAIFNMRNK